MRFRKLRIAWSVAWVIACVLLIVLWVRSFYVWDSPYHSLLGKWQIQFNSLRGYFFVGEQEIKSGDDPERGWNTYEHGQFTDFGAESSGCSWQFTSQQGALGFGTCETDGYRNIFTPYWFLALASAVLAAAPWLRWRFSLRTLLIATTLVAIVLGLAIYTARH